MSRGREEEGARARSLGCKPAPAPQFGVGAGFFSLTNTAIAASGGSRVHPCAPVRSLTARGKSPSCASRRRVRSRGAGDLATRSTSFRTPRSPSTSSTARRGYVCRAVGAGGRRVWRWRGSGTFLAFALFWGLTTDEIMALMRPAIGRTSRVDDHRAVVEVRYLTRAGTFSSWSTRMESSAERQVRP